MFKGYEYRIYPNKTQQKLIAKTFGCCRFVYNYFLQERIQHYEQTKKYINSFIQSKDLTILKQSLIWLKDVDSQALQQELRHLDNAFEKFFKAKKGFPNFKSKHSNRQSYSSTSKAINLLNDNKIALPKLGKVKCKIDRLPQGKIMSACIKQVPSGKYFASLTVQEQDTYLPKEQIKPETTLGIDLGLLTFATLSDGRKIANPRYLKQNISKLKYLQRQLSKKQKGSKNRNKVRIKVARQHERVTNLRKDFLHKLTYSLTHDNQVSTYCIENLNIAKMLKNQWLARSISDVSWSIFTSLLSYKCDLYGKNLIQIGRFEPSSKMCSCGYINKNLTLKDRLWTCPVCGQIHDRDILAAQNIKKFALSKTGQGMPSEPVEVATVVAPVKQELASINLM